MRENLFAKNLRELCLRRGSIAAVCRQIGINRQQFNRYLTGETKPSQHTLVRLTEFFGSDATKLTSPLGRNPDPLLGPWSVFGAAAPSGVACQRYSGRYFTYFRSPNFVGAIIKGFVELRLDQGVFTSRALDVYFRRDTGHAPSGRKIFYRMNGHVTLHGDFLYILDQKMGQNPSFTMTCLHQSHGEHVQLLNGLMIGITYHTDRRPFSTNIVYERMDDRRSLLETVRECGVYEEMSSALSSEVKRRLRNEISDDLKVLVSRGL